MPRCVICCFLPGPESFRNRSPFLGRRPALFPCPHLLRCPINPRLFRLDEPRPARFIKQSNTRGSRLFLAVLTGLYCWPTSGTATPRFIPDELCSLSLIRGEGRGAGIQVGGGSEGFTAKGGSIHLVAVQTAPAAVVLQCNHCPRLFTDCLPVVNMPSAGSRMAPITTIGQLIRGPQSRGRCLTNR